MSMISTFADLLEAFRRKETQLLDKQAITHAPTIGRMYEGLTQTILERAFPEGLDLGVVSGFVANDRGDLSRQIDCMLVSGQGEPIPYTDDHKYHIQNVIAVIEVRKSLYAKGLDSAYSNLISVRKLQGGGLPESRLFNDAHRSILGSDPDNYDDITELPVWKFQLGLVLYIESITPVRIVLGYHGYASETNFRKAFFQHLERNQAVRHYGPSNLPSLITSGGFSLIKLNGMPYSIPVANNQAELYAAYAMPNLADNAPVGADLWPLYASYAGNPMVLLFELIWTRITYDRHVFLPDFGSDLNLEILNPLLLARALERDGEVGWYYERFVLPPGVLKRIPATAEWQPVELDEGQFTVLAVLVLMENSGVADGVDIDSPELLREFENSVYSLRDSIEYLRQVGLASLQDDKLRLLTKECKFAALSDGRVVAGDDSGGRFSKWLITHTQAVDADQV